MVIITISLVATYSRLASVEKEMHENRESIESFSLQVQSNQALIRLVHQLQVLPADAK